MKCLEWFQKQNLKVRGSSVFFPQELLGIHREKKAYPSLETLHLEEVLKGEKMNLSYTLFIREGIIEYTPSTSEARTIENILSWNPEDLAILIDHENPVVAWVAKTRLKGNQ